MSQWLKALAALPGNVTWVPTPKIGWLTIPVAPLQGDTNPMPFSGLFRYCNINYR